MPTKRPWTLNDAFRFGIKHGAIIGTCITLLWGFFTFINRVDASWKGHVADTQAQVAELQQLDHRIDRVEQKLDQLILTMATRHGKF